MARGPHRHPAAQSSAPSGEGKVLHAPDRVGRLGARGGTTIPNKARRRVFDDVASRRHQPSRGRSISEPATRLTQARSAWWHADRAILATFVASRATAALLVAYHRRSSWEPRTYRPSATAGSVVHGMR